jgi:hypothetical protein
MLPGRPGATFPALVLALALAAMACGAPVETTTPVAPTIAPTKAISPGLPATEPPATNPAATDPAATLAPPSPAGDVVQDPSLLEILPAAINGIPVVLEEQGFADAAAVPDFAANVEAAAYGLVVDGEDLGSAVVARLDPGIYSEAFYRSWRDTYNEGACGQSGGVVGNAESQLGERTVYIGTCAGGLRTYHAWLEGRGVIVSAFSLGDRRFGELLMAGLRP